MSVPTNVTIPDITDRTSSNAHPWTGELEFTVNPPCVMLVAPGGRRPCKTVPLVGPIVLGRSPEADLQLYDRWVSRRHCEIWMVDGQLIVRDLESHHGTFVNGQRVMRTRINDGDDMYIGMTRLRVSCRHASKMCWRMRCSACLYPCG